MSKKYERVPRNGNPVQSLIAQPLSKITLHRVPFIGVADIDSWNDLGRSRRLDEPLQLLERRMFAVWDTVNSNAIRGNLRLNSTENGRWRR